MLTPAAKRTRRLTGRCLVDGVASGEVLFSDVPLSFWGGVDPESGVVIDRHHPLHGESLTGRVVAIPSGRGSCGGSGTLLEMLLGGTAPAALVFCHPESILTLGAVIGDELFDQSLPVLRVDGAHFGQLRSMGTVTVAGSLIITGAGTAPDLLPAGDHEAVEAAVSLTDYDRELLSGAHGEACRTAQRIVLRVAQLEGARELVDVELAHVDGVFYQGPASLRFAETLVALGGRVRVPATSNPICVDRRQWRSQGVPSAMGEPSERLATAYQQLGVQPTFTCAPYLLDARPRFGQQVASGESNVVVYSNSVLGARTMKYPNYLEILVALTGRAPLVGCHRDPDRRPTVIIDVAVDDLDALDDSFFPVLGYHLGALAPNDIPVICGLEDLPVSTDDLKSFGAAFASTSAAPMFHLVGITPEAPTLEAVTNGRRHPRHRVTVVDLHRTWAELNTADGPEVDLVSLGTPHFSFTEIGRLAELAHGRHRHPDVQLMITCGRDVYAQAERSGYVRTIEDFGGRFLRDTCWCFVREPVIPPATRTIATTSGKYAHYGAAGVGRGMHLRGLADCVRAATDGRFSESAPSWLRNLA